LTFGCDSLEVVNFAERNALKGIEDSAFSGCLALRQIRLPAGIEFLGKQGFGWRPDCAFGCPSLEFVVFEKPSKLRRL
jgi:hypothetical protein